MCIIPAKGTSQRFARKNVALLRGRPLIVHVIQAALQARIFSEILVSTEDHEISRIAADAGAVVVARPAALSVPSATVYHVVENLLATRHGDLGRVANIELPKYLCVVYPTAALIASKDLQEMEAILDRNETAQGVMTVVRPTEDPWDTMTVDADSNWLTRLFPLSYQGELGEHKVWVDAGLAYLYRTTDFLKHEFYPPRLLPFPIPRNRAVDVNYPGDLKLLEAFYDLGS
jgi:CMP-N-acetylneuraminic acid synthetase